MGTSIITISGGEPLLHPELEEIIRHIRKHGMIAGMITNGFLLSRERINSLNDAAGLEHLQISIDNVTPGRSFEKSLKTLDQPPGMAFAVRGFSGQHQLRARQWREESGRCAVPSHIMPSELGFTQHCWHHPRSDKGS